MSWRRLVIFGIFVALASLLAPARSQAAGLRPHTLGDDPALGPVIHVVQQGETLAAIATRYGATIQDLLQRNSLRNPNVIFVGQRLLVSGTIVGQEPAAAGGWHVVRRGETLTAIARRYGTTVVAIQRANGLRSSMIYIGQRLRIPTGSGAAPASGAHVVQKGETLTSIAKRYGVTVQALAGANGLKPTALVRIGQRLALPGSRGAKPAARGPKKIVVSISQQRCWRYEGEVLLNTWRCSTARKGYGTRTGTFHIQSKLRKAYGSTWDIWMPYWLGIYWSGPVENGLHGLPWNAKTGARTWAGLVGTPITYGCVMLTDAAMKEVWNWADIGTTVVIKR